MVTTHTDEVKRPRGRPRGSKNKTRNSGALTAPVRHVGFNMPVDLLVSLNTLAERNDRNLSAEIRRALRMYVAERLG
jgi:hypothetical protein